MKKFRKNNKGFSLVELIVVVLIIAIIAVALAPQVIKWVGEARTNADTNQKATIKSAIQTCVAEAQSKQWTIPTDATGFKVKGGTEVLVGGKKLSEYSSTNADEAFYYAVCVACADLKDTKEYTVKIAATTYVVTVE